MRPASKQPRSRTPLIVFTLIAAFITWGALKTLVFGSKCDMQANLNVMLGNLLDTFEAANIVHYLDDGTLLGFYRDGHITSYEFDLDISIPFEEYSKMLALKDTLARTYDFTLYKEGDYIFQKAWTMLYTLKWDPYLPHLYPCFRIYDPSKWYYADIYCDHTFNKTEMLKITQFPPRGWDDPANADQDYLCDMEPIEESCMMRKTIYPLGSLKALGRQLPVPNDIPTFLSNIYGLNGWQVPRAKGIKVIICNRYGWWVSVLVSAALVAWLLRPLKAYVIERMRPQTGRLPKNGP